MAGSKRKRLPRHLNSIRLSGKMNPLPQSQMLPTPPLPTDTTGTSTEVVGDQPIPALAAVSGLEDSNDPPQSPIPRFISIFGKLYPVPPTGTSPLPPADTSVTSNDLVADQPIPAVSAVNGPQDTDIPLQPPARPAHGQGGRPSSNGTALNPNALGQRERPSRNGAALDPKNVGSWFREEKGFHESYLWYPGFHIPGRQKKGFQMSLGSYLTEQEAQDVHDRAALKLFQTNGVVPILNFHESRHTEFMEQYRDWNFRDFVWQLRRCSALFSAGKSSMKGVTVRGKKFEAKAAKTQGGVKVHYNFRKHESEEEAGRAYDRGLLFLHHEDTEEQKLDVITNFRPSGYSESEILRAGREYCQQYKDSDPSRIA